MSSCVQLYIAGHSYIQLRTVMAITVKYSYTTRVIYSYGHYCYYSYVLLLLLRLLQLWLLQFYTVVCSYRYYRYGYYSYHSYVQFLLLYSKVASIDTEVHLQKAILLVGQKDWNVMLFYKSGHTSGPRVSKATCDQRQTGVCPDSKL